MRITCQLTTNSERIIKQFIKLSGNHKNIRTYLKEFLKLKAKIGAVNAIEIISNGDINYKDFKSYKPTFDKNFKAYKSTRYDLVISEVVYDGLVNNYKIDNLLNKKQSKKPHPSVEAYIFLLVEDESISINNDLKTITQKH